MKVSKKKITEKILEYVFKKYSKDKEIKLLMEDYYTADKIAKEHKNNKIIKNDTKYYKITQPVRDFLEPLVDAEYFKSYNYTYEIDGVILDAMDQLKTKLSECLNERRNHNTK